MPKYRRGSGNIYKKRSVYYIAYYANGKQVCESTGTTDNGEINRELAALKRMFNLAFQAEQITRKPHIPMLEENNARQGFFERAAYEAVLVRLPDYLRPPVTFAYRLAPQERGVAPNMGTGRFRRRHGPVRSRHNEEQGGAADLSAPSTAGTRRRPVAGASRPLS